MTHRWRTITGSILLGLLFGMGIGSGPVHATPQDDLHLDYGEVVHGTLGNGISEQTWTFSGRAGDLIMIDMQAAMSDLDPYLTLLDSAGGTLYTDDDSGEGLNSRIGPIELTDTGEYAIRATSYSGSGQYVLQAVNLAESPLIQPEKPLVGTVNPDHPTDYFRLLIGQSDAGKLFRLVVTDDQRYSDPVLSLYRLLNVEDLTEGAAHLITSTEFSSEGVIDPLVPLPGRTYVIAVSWNSSSPGGAYELTLNASQVELMQNGTTQTGRLDYEAYSHPHYFRGAAGDIVRVTARVTAGAIVPNLEIDSIDFEYYLFSSDGGATLETSVLLELPEDTVYVVYVRDGSYTGESGEYEITVEWVE